MPPSPRPAVALLSLAAALLLVPPAAGAEGPPAPAEPPAGDPLPDGPAGDPEPRGEDLRATVKARRPPADPTASAYRAPGEELRRSSRDGLLERLSSHVPGLHVTAKGPDGYGLGPGAAGGLRLRGLGGTPTTEILVLDDGIPDVMGLFGHPIPDAYQSFALRSAEVLPGGDGVLFGSGAMGGAIVLETGWPEEVGPAGRLALETGAFATRSADAGVSLRAGDLEVTGGGRLLHSDGSREFSGTDQQHLLVKGRWSPSRSVQLLLRQRTTLLEGQNPGPASQPVPDRWYDVRRYHQGARLEWREGASFATATAWAGLGDHRLADGFRSRDETYGLWLEGGLRPRERLSLRAGLDLRHTGGTAENVETGADFGSHGSASAGPYLQASYDATRWLTLVAGGRLQWLEGRDPFVLGKAGAEARPWEGGRLFARVSQGFREPTLVERFLPMPVANPDLEPERSTHLESGVGHRFAGGEVQVAAWHQRARNLIRTLGVFPDLVRANAGRADLSGIEGTLDLALVDPLRLRLAGSHSFLGELTAGTPATLADAALIWEGEVFRAALSGTGVAGLHAEDHSRQELPSFVVFDLRLDGRVGEHVSLWFVARNLGDRPYAYLPDYPMPGRSAYLGLEVRS